MISSTYIFTDSSPTPTVSAHPNPVNTSNDGEAQPSFDDVLQQQDGSSSNSNTPTENSSGSANTNRPPPAPAADSAPASPQPPATGQAPADSTPPPPPTPTPAKAPTTTVSNGSDLHAMMVQAAILAANAQRAAEAKATTNPPADADTNSGKNPPSASDDATDIASLIAKASLLLSLPPQVGTPRAAGGATSTPGGKPGADAKGSAADNSAPSVTGATDLSTLIAQASILISSAQQAAGATAGAGKDLPLSGSNKGLAGITGKEKKSGSSSDEGSFLQSGKGSSDGTSSLDGLLSSALGGAVNLTLNQQVAAPSASKNSSLPDPSIGALSLGGTANVEKGKAMNADLSIPEMGLLSGPSANALTQQSGADLHIQLSSNNDFQDALKQVMHVAQLTQTNESRMPMRVAMEIQTPPGAIVNVYVSRQNDQYRAQLSTNDPAALSWVQDQMSSLRQSNDMGVSVRWLPPQIESSPMTTSTGQDANLGWDRGGQGQSNYQQPDDRRQSNRQNQPDSAPEFAGASSSPFMNTLSGLGRAA